MKSNTLFSILILSSVLIVILAVNTVSALNATVCCEKTKSGLYCQDIPQSECLPNSRQVPSSCSSTSYCKAGTCYDSTEGTCADNTPQLVCNQNGGTWSEKSPAQCDLGCCVLGDQAAFVPLVACKRLSSLLGLQTNYHREINDEVQCILSVQDQERGACVYNFEFEKTCKFTTREDCVSGGANGTGAKGDFSAGKLCSNEELGTNCAPTRRTTCVAGKDEVFFVDSCGNPANIYDSSKINDKAYWANIKDKSEVCNPNSANGNSAGCGNCNYLLGSICRSSKAAGAKATYGDNICADLNCKKTQNGQSYKHGESWCVYDDKGVTGKSNNAVGSRFYKHICINGEEVLEQCADFRQEECIQDKITTPLGDFSQAACRVNRWQDCTAQFEKKDCENTDRRDCAWVSGSSVALRAVNSTSGATGACVPQNTPGLKFWQGDDANTICSQANIKCIVTFEKGLFGGESCVGNCDCLDDSWTRQHTDICMALGDCGPKINWVGDLGYKPGFKVKTK